MVNWGNAILVAVLGLATVFAVLIIIMIALMIMTKIFAPAKKEAPKPNNEPKIKTPPPAPKQETMENSDDSELVAVIAAAIASYLDKPVSSLRIKSYRRLGEAKTSWGSISRKENIYKGF